MSMQNAAAAIVSVVAAVWLAGCATGSGRGGLTARIGEAVRYRSPDGTEFVARYGSLSDGSLHFVKVEMPGGREYTLPQVVSASGVRYTDERELVWWTHQGTVAVETRDENGNWGRTYPELRELPRE